MSTFTLQLRKSDWTGLFDTLNNHVNSLNINVPHVRTARVIYRPLEKMANSLKPV